MSTTSGLVKITRSVSGAKPCEAYLGVGHTHRREGILSRNERPRFYEKQEKRPASRRGRRRQSSKEITSPAASNLTRGGSNETFMWGYQYTHFFYTVAPHAPFHTLATSSEFCIAALQDHGDCESVQCAHPDPIERACGLRTSPVAPTTAYFHHSHNDPFILHPCRFRFVSSIATAGNSILLSYGVNDCEAKVAKVPLERVWGMLHPLDAASGVCM